MLIAFVALQLDRARTERVQLRHQLRLAPLAAVLLALAALEQTAPVARQIHHVDARRVQHHKGKAGRARASASGVHSRERGDSLLLCECQQPLLLLISLLLLLCTRQLLWPFGLSDFVRRLSLSRALHIALRMLRSGRGPRKRGAQRGRELGKDARTLGGPVECLALGGTRGEKGRRGRVAGRDEMQRARDAELTERGLSNVAAGRCR